MGSFRVSDIVDNLKKCIAENDEEAFEAILKSAPKEKMLEGDFLLSLIDSALKAGSSRSNLPPVIAGDAPTTYNDVNEGMASDSTSFTALAMDPTGGEVTNSLTGTDASTFSINPSSVTTVDSPPEGYATKTSYDFNAETQGPSDAFSTQSISVNVNELSPEISRETSAARRPSFVPNLKEILEKVELTDPERISEFLFKKNDKGQTILHSATPLVAQYFLEQLPDDLKLKALLSTDNSGTFLIRKLFGNISHESFVKMMELIPKEQLANIVLNNNKFKNTMIHDAIARSGENPTELGYLLDLLPKEQRMSALFSKAPVRNDVLEFLLPLIPDLKVVIAARKLLESKQNFKIAEKESEDDLKRRLVGNEGSMDSNLMLSANAWFEHKVRPLFKETFEEYGPKGKKGISGNTALETIEFEIRKTILKRIEANSKEETKLLKDEQANLQKDLDSESKKVSPDRKKIDRLELKISAVSKKLEQNREIQFFIEQNRSLLEKSDKETLSKARAIFISKVDNAQIAWRNYDKDARVRGAWPSLFVTPDSRVSNDIVFSTAESIAGPATRGRTSDIVRERAAYYYLVAVDPKVPKSEDRISSFINYLAEIRRSHNQSLTEDDDPSCFPGHITRLANTALEHPEARQPSSAKKIIVNIINDAVLRQFRGSLLSFKNEDKEKRAKLYYALAYLSDQNAEEIAQGKIKDVVANEITGDLESYDRELFELRLQFENSLNKNELILKIDETLKKELGRPLTDCESMFLYFLFLNLGTELQTDLQREYRLLVEPTPSSKELEQRASAQVGVKPGASTSPTEKSEINANPFSLKMIDELVKNKALPEPMKKRQIEKVWNSHHAFNILAKELPPLLKETQEKEIQAPKPSNTFNEFIKDFVQEIYACDQTELSEKIKEALKNLQQNAIEFSKADRLSIINTLLEENNLKKMATRLSSIEPYGAPLVTAMQAGMATTAAAATTMPAATTAAVASTEAATTTAAGPSSGATSEKKEREEKHRRDRPTK